MKPRTVIIVATIIVAFVAVGGALAWAQSMRLQLRNKEVAHANALAAKDTAIVRLVAAGDSQVAVTRRLAYQGEVDLQDARVAFGDLLRDTVAVLGVSLAQFRIRGDSLEQVIEGMDAEVDTAGTITVVGNLDATDSLGISVKARVEIPSTLISPLWMWNVTRAPLPLSVGLQCEGTRAVAYVTGPLWALIALDSVVQDDEICNPLPSGWKPFRIEVPSVPVAAGLVLGGMVLESILQLFGER